MQTEIAIVGMACRYADATSPAELWENVLAQRRAFRRIPEERLNHQDYISDDLDMPDTTYVTEAAVIANYEFDRIRYRVAGSTFRTTDMTHWLALDIAAQALADAGFVDGHGLPHAQTRVVIGNTLTGEFSRANLMRLRWPYVRRVVDAALTEETWSPAQRATFLEKLEAVYKQPFAPVDSETLAGGLANTIAGRICNYFDLKGGGYTVDGACASSLLAVHAACTALATREVDVALAGGVDLSLDPFELVGFAKNGALAPEKMRVYDAQSAGFWPGEGCGFVVLMRHEDAIAQNHRVYAVIRGWGMSSDGTGGITRPEAEGQYLALARAYEQAGFTAGTVPYFEGHGTGTTVGDAVELQTLLYAQKRAAGKCTPAVVGTVKANIGHTKAAAGLAGLIKAAMAVYQQILPPTTGCETPHLHLQNETLHMLPKGKSWPTEHPLRAGISAMGFGGINTHLVIEGTARKRRDALTEKEEQLLRSAQDAELFVLGAENPASLQKKVEQLIERVPHLSLSELTDLAAHLADTVEGSQIRAAVVAGTPLELTVRLRAILSWLQIGLKTWLDTQAGAFLGTPSIPPRIGYIFPGQASPVYLEEGIWGRRFPFAAETHSKLNLPTDSDTVSTAVAQPAIVNASLIGLQALEHVGIQANSAMGHSLGELTALHWAGAVDADALLKLAMARGSAIAHLGEKTGAMMSIEVDQQSAQWLFDGDAITIACFNAPRQTVISGDVTAIDAVARRAEAQRIKTTRLPVSHAFHSPLVAAAVRPLQSYLVQQPFSPLQRPVYSTVTGARLPADAHVIDLLARQIIQPVRFMQAFTQLAQEVDLLLEVGPGYILSRLVKEFNHLPIISLDANGSSLAGFLRAVGAAYVLGAPVKIKKLFTDRFTRPINLNQPQTFFASPCEAAPELKLDTAVTRSIPQPTAAPTPTDTPTTTTEISPITIVRQLISAETELPVTAINNEDRLLSDLHLNSITVSQIVAKAARQLGLTPPVAPTNYADVSVATVARTLGERVGKTNEPKHTPPESPPERFPAGVDAWVHGFALEKQKRPLPAPTLAEGAGQWTVIAPDNHPLTTPLQQHMNRYQGRGIVLCLPEAPDESHIPLLLDAAHTALNEEVSHFVLVQYEQGASAFVRSLYLEMKQVTACVVTVPPHCPDAVHWIVAEARAARGFVAASYDETGTRYETDLKVHLLARTSPPQPISWLSAHDVVIVTGGGKGITAECVLSLAQQTQVQLALVGVSVPEEDQELAQNLERMQAYGIQARYYICDITQPEAVAALVQRVESELGSVTGIIHGAARNLPRLLSAMDTSAVLEALAPKLQGLQHLLQTVDAHSLRLLVTFGSIIGRSGLYGEAHYALANEWLAHLITQFQRAHSDCRCLNVEWSVWSKAGMAARLGQIDHLTQTGITPISPEVGVPLFLQMLADETRLPTSVVVTGRYGNIPTLAFAQPKLPFWRFLEEPRIHYAGVELITETKLSAYTDLYLADHRVQGQLVFPGVMGLEAMAQVAMALMETEERPFFENVEFHRPIIVPANETTKLRIAALVRSANQVDVVVRSAETDFQVDHFRATCQFFLHPHPHPEHKPPVALTELPPVNLDPHTYLYNTIMFQGERFQQVQAYQHLSALNCLAQINQEQQTNWFSGYLPSAFVLGAPGSRDAYIHAVQVCTPHKVLLPVSVAQIVIYGNDTSSPVRLYAQERKHWDDTYLYDLIVVDEHNNLLEQWQGLQLRSMSGAGFQGPWAAPLLGPYLERHLEALQPQMSIKAAMNYQPDLPRQEQSNLAICRALGENVLVQRRSDGKPEVPTHASTVSASHAADLTLAVASPHPVSCDIEFVTDRPIEVWQDLLGPEHFSLVNMIQRESAEVESVTATRIWGAKECLQKVGAMTSAPLTLSTVSKDGWISFTSGHFYIVTAQVHTIYDNKPLVLTILVSTNQT